MGTRPKSPLEDGLMSNKIKNPNEKSNSFLWALLALVVVVAAVVAYIVINGKEAANSEYADRPKEDVSFEVTAEDSTITLASANAAADAAKIDLYEDYSCPYCSKLAIATDADMKTALEDGTIVVTIHPLNFLDRGAEEGHSTRAGTAATLVAKSGDAKAYWNFRSLLMTDQEEIYGQWDNAKFGEIAGVYGANEDTVNKIKDGSEMATFRDYAAKNADHLTEVGGQVSSPRVFIDGTEVTSSLETWVEQATA